MTEETADEIITILREWRAQYQVSTKAIEQLLCFLELICTDDEIQHQFATLKERWIVFTDGKIDANINT